MAEPGEGFYPYQAGIDAYGNGGFRFAGMSHRGSLLCLPTGMHAWRDQRRRDHARDAWRRSSPLADQIDVLLIGLGDDIAGLDPAIRAALRERSIIVEAIATGGAVRTYNILLGEERAVGGRADRRRQRALMSADSSRYAAELLRDSDRDRYFATLVLTGRRARRRPGALCLQRRRRLDPRSRVASPAPAKSGCNGGTTR